VCLNLRKVIGYAGLGEGPGKGRRLVNPSHQIGPLGSEDRFSFRLVVEFRM